MSEAGGPTVRAHAPAKINLALHVTGRREDGYHLLESLVVFTKFGDEVEISASEADSFRVDGPFAHAVPAGGDNLVLRARDTLSALAKVPAQSAAIRLTKNLPIASGIGGGSSDAAAAMKALNRLWKSGLTLDQLAEIAAPLGADVPMCVLAKPLIARGIGERIEPIALPEIPLVLVNPGIPVPTPEVFKALPSATNPPLPALPDQRDLATFFAWLATTRNDLQTPAIARAPIIADALSALELQGAGFARMSGSGATCFGLFQRQADALRAAMAIRAAQPGWFVVATHSMA